MDREEYIGLLEEKNGYCNCLYLQSLLIEKRKAIDLEKIGHDEASKKAVRKYYAELTNLVSSGKLPVFSHNLEKKCAERVYPGDMKRGMTLTIHCSECNQQIDIIDDQYLWSGR